MLTGVLDNDGVVYHKFVLAEQTINEPLYAKVLKRLREVIRKNRPTNLQERPSLHPENAPSHTPIVVRTLLAEICIPLLH